MQGLLFAAPRDPDNSDELGIFQLLVAMFVFLDDIEQNLHGNDRAHRGVAKELRSRFSLFQDAFALRDKPPEDLNVAMRNWSSLCTREYELKVEAGEFPQQRASLGNALTVSEV